MDMANYDTAYRILRKHEGGYAIGDPDDSGGETWIGVSRANFPSWEGWIMIDIIKTNPNFPKMPGKEAKKKAWRKFFKEADKLFYASEELEIMVYEFYLLEFWHKVKGDDISIQVVADSIFNFAVNAGIRTGSKVAQLTCGAKPDGVIGAKTVGKLNTMDSEKFIMGFTLGKITFYRNICKNKRHLRKYMYTWVSRSLEV